MSRTSAGLQHVVQGLSSFWVDRGCALLPPCSLEIPAALLHPKTFFRLLDPSPWNGVVAQPVSRPVDGRRGRHPFRTSVHLQLQVALQRPEPRGVRDAVVESLRHLGLDPARHHLRLDTWRWTLDAVGAHGVGWRLTLDGMGIGRVTFLERLADHEIPQDRVDVTYGVEHLALVLSGVDSVYRLPWQSVDDGGDGGDGGDGEEEGSETLRYDQLRRSDEEEQSRYVEEVANVGHLRQVLDGLEREARRCLDAELVRPAYERAIECLAVLDVLDVRRDLSDRERDEWTAAVRRVVAGAAKLHLARRPAADEPPKETVTKVDAAKDKPGTKSGQETSGKVTSGKVTSRTKKSRPKRSRKAKDQAKKDQVKKHQAKKDPTKKPGSKKPAAKQESEDADG